MEHRSVQKAVAIKIALICSCLLLISCSKANNEISGVDIATINKAFPNISDSLSCEWKYEKIDQDSFLSVGPNVYSFYGNVHLTDAEYQKLLIDYSWKNVEEGDCHSDYFRELLENTDFLLVSEEYTERTLSESKYVYGEFVLDKKMKIIYFYAEL